MHTKKRAEPVLKANSFDGDIGQLAPMRAFLREVCRESWLCEPAEEELMGRLTLALTEAASNIILHGFEGQQSGPITLTVALEDDQVCVTLQHTGKPFDPQRVDAPVFDGSQESGFGLYLMRQC